MKIFIILLLFFSCLNVYSQTITTEYIKVGEVDQNYSPNNLEKIEKFLGEIYGTEYKIMSVDSNEWASIKNKFIINKKNNVGYEIMPELENVQNQNKKNTKFENITKNIFGDEVENIN